MMLAYRAPTSIRGDAPMRPWGEKNVNPLPVLWKRGPRRRKRAIFTLSAPEQGEAAATPDGMVNKGVKIQAIAAAGLLSATAMTP